MTVVVIDPGHGGTARIGQSSHNNAKGPSGLLEKTVTLDIAKRMVPHLEKRGYTVVLTRKADNNLDLVDRAKAAKSISAPVFLSIHLNGYDSSTQGSETFCHLKHSGQSADLCRAVQKRLVAATGLKDRNQSHPGGVKRQALGVLNPSVHHAKTACCLTEISFMDVKAEEDRLKTGPYLDALAVALVDGISDYLHLTGLAKTAPATEFGDTMEAQGLAEAPNARPVRGKVETLTDDDASEGMNDIGEQAPSLSETEFVSSLKLLPVAGGFPLADFDAFISSLKLRYFSAEEFLAPGGQNQTGKCKGLNTYPPKELWENIGATARMLDEIRHRLAAPCFINSAYRSPAYNTCIGGEKASLHMRFNAIDFRCTKGNAQQWHAVAVAVRASSPNYLGGIGRYKSFVHIDTRGKKADW